MHEVFLDTNVFIKIFNKEKDYEKTINSIAEIKSKGYNLKISCITHFEILWGFALYGEDKNVRKYEKLLETLEIEVIPLTKKDVEVSAKYCRNKAKIRDYFIGASVKNRNSYLLTYNISDFRWLEKVSTPEDFIEHR